MRQKKIAFNINDPLNKLIINAVIIKFFINSILIDLITLNRAMKSLIKKWMQEWKYDISLKKQFDNIPRIHNYWFMNVWNVGSLKYGRERLKYKREAIDVYFDKVSGWNEYLQKKSLEIMDQP